MKQLILLALLMVTSLCLRGQSASNPLTISNIAWKEYKYLIKDGVFMTKDIDVLQARLAVFDAYFMPDMHNNLFNEFLEGLEQYNHSIQIDLWGIKEQVRRRKKARAIIIPSVVLISFISGVVINEKRHR